MQGILTAAAIMGGLGLLFGAVLALAYRFLRVPEDPRIDQVEGMLPASNCGACGEAGCRAFAEKVVKGERPPSGCTVSNEAAREAIAELLGVDAGKEEKRVARLHCAGGHREARQMAAYEGHGSCRGAGIVGGGGKLCPWGCLGLGDCATACQFDAIQMNDDGLPVVDLELCVACGDCVTACPRSLFEILPLSHHLVLQCSAPLAGDQARALCSVACDACGRCAQDAAAGLIRMERNLPRVDYAAGGPAEPKAVLRCPTGAIRWIEAQQFQALVSERRGAKKSHG